MLLAPLAFTLLLAGCGAPTIKGKLAQPTFHMQMSSLMPSRNIETITTPKGQIITISRTPELQTEDLADVELRRAKDGTLFLAFYCTSDGAKKLNYQMTSGNPGRVVVTKVNGEFLGMNVINGPANRGVWYVPMTDTTLPEEQLVELTARMKDTITKTQEALKKHYDRTKPIGAI